MMIEQLSWGDAGQYLCLPHPMLGGAAVDSAGTPEQRLRFLQKFTEGDPKWGAMAITEPDAGSDNSSMRTTAVLDEETERMDPQRREDLHHQRQAGPRRIGRPVRRLGHD